MISLQFVSLLCLLLLTGTNTKSFQKRETYIPSIVDTILYDKPEFTGRFITNTGSDVTEDTEITEIYIKSTTEKFSVSTDEPGKFRVSTDEPEKFRVSTDEPEVVNKTDSTEIDPKTEIPSDGNRGPYVADFERYVIDVLYAIENKTGSNVSWFNFYTPELYKNDPEFSLTDLEPDG
ncbi:uncharacterized protein [Centruroides vittatus]|uniref:uncharacterized protein n=1 Tax=Centruroides vittatus TaxID=120091 RepID=UPI0035105F39